MEELALSKFGCREETKNLLQQLKEACEEAWSKITAFDRLVTSHSKGISLGAAKDKRAHLEEIKLKLEKKIKENNTLIQNAHENIDLQTATVLKLTNQYASDARIMKKKSAMGLHGDLYVNYR